MSQISPPMRIVLVAAILFMAAWFTVLKPGGGEVTDPGAAVSSKAGEFAATAKAGAATAERDAAGAANATLEDDTAAAAPSATTPSVATGSATTAGTQNVAPAPPLSDKALAKLPVPIRRALKSRKVLVLGVVNTASESWAPMADDERAVRHAIKHANRYGGEVAIQTAPVDKLARYEGLLNALAVTQTPTVVVVDRDRHATALTGYVDRKSVNQAIVDARRATTEPLIKDKYLAAVNRECARGELRMNRLDLPASPSAFGRYASRVATVARLYGRRIGSIKAPARWRPLRGRMMTSLRNQAAVTQQLAAAAVAGDVGGVRRLTGRSLPAVMAEAAALDRRLNAVGLTSCTSVRTH